MSDQSKDVGSILRQERERQGLTLDMVHEATKIPMDSLKAIEEGYKVRTLSPFYFKSFIRIYAQHLNLDAQELLGQASQEPVRKMTMTPANRPVAAGVQETISLNLFARSLHPHRGKKILKIAGIVAAVVVVLLLVAGLVKRMKARAAVNNALAAASASTTKKPARGALLQKNATVKKSETIPTETRQSATVSQTSDVSKKAGAQSTAETKTIAAKSAASTGNVSVAVRAQNNSWLYVKADGSTVFQGIMKKGTADSWTANKSLEISGRDIEYLEFEVNGKSIGKLSRSGMKAKRVRITAEGLTVEK